MSDKTIGRIATGVVALAIFFTAIFLADLFGFAPTQSFWETLFASILAGLVVISALGLLLPIYLRVLFAPQLEIEPEEDFRLVRYFDNRLKGTLRLNLCNRGVKTVRSFYWHLVIPHGLNPVVQDLRGRIIGARKVGEFEYVHGLVDNQPIFPSSAFELPVMISLDTADYREDWTIKYALTTEYGHFPKEMEMHRLMDASAVADCASFAVHAEVAKEAVKEEIPTAILADQVAETDEQKLSTANPLETVTV